MSDSGWGSRASVGRRGSDLGSPSEARWLVVVRGLPVPLLLLWRRPDLASIHILSSSGVVAVRWVGSLVSFRSLPLLRASVDLIPRAVSRCPSLSAFLVPGQVAVWANPLSRQAPSSVEWSLSPGAFRDVVDCSDLLDVGLFPARASRRLPFSLFPGGDCSGGRVRSPSRVGRPGSFPPSLLRLRCSWSRCHWVLRGFRTSASGPSLRSHGW